MAGLNIGQLDLPPDAFRVDLRTDDPTGIIKFETVESKRAEDDRDRLRPLERLLKRAELNRGGRHAVKRLIKVLKRALAGKASRLSPASSLIMRAWRIAVCGALWMLIAPLGKDDWVFFTIILPSWWVRSEDLHKLRAERLMASLRTDLNRAGAAGADGWLYAMIHGEFDATTGGFQLHVHGLATKGMIKVLRKLRKQPKYRRGKRDQERYPLASISRKLKIDKPRGFLPTILTYTSKSYWVEHNSTVEDSGKRKRLGEKRRISGKHHTRYLLWLDAHELKDLILLMHLRVSKQGLIARK